MIVSKNLRVCRCLEEAQLGVITMSKKRWGADPTYIEIPSSLIIYPIPYPSAATGPKPNKRRAGLPQLEVERMEVFKTVHPWSVKIVGNEPLDEGGGTGSSGEGSRFPPRSRKRRQYKA